MPSTRTDEVVALARRQGIITARALREQGIAPAYLQRLTARGVLTRVARGIYELADGADITAMHTLVEACLPQVPYPPLRIVRFGGAARTTGMEHHLVEGQDVRVYSVAKTVADCFKYRNKIGLDVAIEALNDARRGRRATADDLWRAATVDRVTNVMRPYLEAVQDRLSLSPHRDRFVLKGASLFAIWAAQPYRATRDIDLEGFGPNDPDAVIATFRQVCAVVVDDDGLTLLPDAATAATIRDEEGYGSVRIPARLGNAHTDVQIDVGYGDAITPPAAEVDYPTLLPFPAPRLRAYPRETVVAEKWEAMVSLGSGMTH